MACDGSVNTGIVHKIRLLCTLFSSHRIACFCIMFCINSFVVHEIAPFRRYVCPSLSSTAIPMLKSFTQLAREKVSEEHALPCDVVRAHIQIIFRTQIVSCKRPTAYLKALELWSPIGVYLKRLLAPEPNTSLSTNDFSALNLVQQLFKGSSRKEYAACHECT